MLNPACYAALVILSMQSTYGFKTDTKAETLDTKQEGLLQQINKFLLLQ